MIFLAENVNLRNAISANVDPTSTLLLELVSLRDGHLFLDGGCQLTRSELQHS